MTERNYVLIYSPVFSELLYNCLPITKAKVDRTISLLESTPFLGAPYDPSTEEPDAPMDGLRTIYVPGTSKTLYYVVKEGESELDFITMEDANGDPRHRFAGVH